MEYNFREIEKKWQAWWNAHAVYKVKEDASKPKYYVLDMFPYPSGAGLHVGHPLGYIASDIYSRYKRLQGFNVLHPMGYDAYGLPAEQYAIQTGQHPAITTEKNIARYREQMDKIGFSFDWSREVRTSEPDYYHWTQWAFIKMFNSYYCYDEQQARPIEELVSAFEQVGTDGLNVANGGKYSFTADEWKAMSEKEKQEVLLDFRIAYLGDTMVNWCADLGTVLANDEVVNGVSERGGYPVEQKVMRQWCLRVSAYAQRLLDGLDTIDWTDSLKETQRNWIGRSEGAEIVFHLSPNPSPQERGERDPKGSFKETTDSRNWNLLIDIAKEYRANQTEAEDALWQALRAGQIGYKIRRQHIVNGYIADFINLEKSVIIEVDGGIHQTSEQKEKDELRTRILNDQGFQVIRFTNNEVLANPQSVANQIKDYLDQKSIPNTPLSCGEGTGERCFTVFTTRADTIFGVTFMVLAPESELVDVLTTAEQKEAVEAYKAATKKKTERERIAEKKVTGVFSGSYAVNPLTGEDIPVWISDYVLAGYGTGAIMAVPGHDSRDYAFAKHFNLPIIPLIEGCDISEESFDAKEGIMTNSPQPGKGLEGGLVLNGLEVQEAIAKTKQYVEEKGLGKVKVNFRLRDAIFSRQRYWGEPFPVYYDADGLPQMLPLDKLPLKLPEVSRFLPTAAGDPPLGNATVWAWDILNEEVVDTARIDHKTIFPLELNTMPGFAGSSAYYIRYEDPHNDKALVDKDVNAYWQNVDLYLGGTEHATGHLIYSRFWNKFLFDLGIIKNEEPFQKLINQGMIQGRSNFVYRINGTNKFVSLNLKDQYETTPLHVDVNIVSNDILDLEAFRNWNPEYKTAEFILEEDKYICGWAIEKMSKSMFNVVNPDMIVDKFGADTLRLYEMFLGPLEQSKPWDTNGIDGVHRFLKKTWGLFYSREGNLLVTDEAATADELKALHKLIKKVAWDIEHFSFNTSISAFMICVNELTSLKCNKKAILEPLLVVLAPFAPHITEELWHVLGHETTICDAEWPAYNEEYLKENSVTYAISFNGKARFNLELPADMKKEDVEKAALSHDNSAKWMDGKVPKKVIVVPGKIVNIVI
ncbi:leucyl-tRNA synthetase [Parabacteroides sp. PFB2-12]|uniref:leucine--tRNA ligase n=1 Tax=unclassified Parabacteroides TaxID=2649774 RepID=UPI0024731183|nr:MULTISPECIES: leucine--tRNA ligase [unclassified Parabacteroides]MDH6343246.1 leucyl-tRNA synthetase [Parabacteroides sp. PM6-13]MDH6390262.1 leucyl-tRNA synthetase [Parabacteroides sp. PFB2-12]